MLEIFLAVQCAIALGFLVLYLRFRKYRGRHGLYFLFKRLRTTPGQEQVIRTAMSRVREAGRIAARETRQARPELAGLIRSEDFDESSARTWLASRERTLENIKPNLIESLKEIHSVLDPEQRKVLGDALESGRHGCGRSHYGCA